MSGDPLLLMGAAGGLKPEKMELRGVRGEHPEQEVKVKSSSGLHI